MSDDSNGTLESEARYYKKLTETLRKELVNQRLLYQDEHEQRVQHTRRAGPTNNTGGAGFGERLKNSIGSSAISFGIYLASMVAVGALNRYTNTGSPATQNNAPGGDIDLYR